MDTTFNQTLDQSIGSLPVTFGNRYYVDANGNGGDGSRRDFTYTGLANAEDSALTNNEDQLILSSNSSHTLTTGIAMDKSRLSLIGLDGGGDRLIQQGTKIQTTDAAAVAYVMKNTGPRNSFRNIKFIMNDKNAAALNVVQDGSEGVLYKNCSFVFGVIDNLDETTASEFLAGSDSGSYIDCEFGTETLLTSAARTVFTIDQVTTSQEFKSNRMRGCNFIISSSETTATLLKVAANTDVLFSNNIVDSTFVASIDSAGGVALAVAVKSAASLVKGTVNFANCSAYGCTNLMSDAVGNDNFYAYGAVNTGTDHVGVLGVAT